MQVLFELFGLACIAFFVILIIGGEEQRGYCLFFGCGHGLLGLLIIAVAAGIEIVIMSKRLYALYVRLFS